MTEEQFWNIIEASRQGITACDEQVHVLTRLLGKLSPEDIVAFDTLFFEKRRAAYRWDLWGVAYIINGGCSDDGFEYFRCWLIGQGKTIYHQALEDPQTLAEYLTGTEEDLECEELMHATNMAYESLVGQKLPATSGQYPPTPLGGERWEEEELAMRFPKVWQKFS